MFNWTLPELPNGVASQKCVVRIRYNISTNDAITTNTLANQMNLSSAEASKRGYTFKNKPAVKLFADLDFTLNLAVNTAQFGRVFQDR